MERLSRKNSKYVGSEGRHSAYDYTPAGSPASSGLVVFVHGYKGFKDWGPWQLVASAFSDAGFDFLKFNFSHNGGTVEEPIDFPDLEAFAKNTYSKEVEDLGHVLDLFESSGYSGQAGLPIYLIGHSRGGGISILRTAQDKRIKKLATWAAVADFGERFDFDLDKWQKSGVTYVENSRTQQKLPHDFSFYTDFIDNRERLDIGEAAGEIAIPWLIVHGTEDEAVSPHDADRLHAHAKKAELFFVKGAGHTFAGSHPWEDENLPNFLQIVVKKTIDFFRR